MKMVEDQERKIKENKQKENKREIRNSRKHIK